MRPRLAYAALVTLGPNLVLGAFGAHELSNVSYYFDGDGFVALGGVDGANDNVTLTLELGSRDEAHGLLAARQECYDGMRGFCCLDSQSCVDDGCCQGEQTQCGSAGCYDPSTDICCQQSSLHCPKGYDCVNNGQSCCPSGQVPCGDSNKCYNPAKSKCCQGDDGSAWGCDLDSECCDGGFCASSNEHCCDNGSCLNEDTCCEEQCCRSIAFCGGDGFCTACDPATVKETSSYTYTTTSTKTTTITEAPEPDEDLPEFTCAPISVTNSNGDVLELGDDCSFEYQPADPSSSASSGAKIRDAGLTIEPRNMGNILAARETRSCKPYYTITSTVISTISSTERTTVTQTTTADPSDEGFKCPEMSVTNDAGDELSLNEDCEFEYSPASPTSSTAATQGSDGETGQSSDSDSNNADDEDAALSLKPAWHFVCLVLVVGVVVQA